MKDFQEETGKYGPGALAFSPLGLWQTSWQAMLQWQQAWLKLLAPQIVGWGGGRLAGSSTDAWSWSGTQSLMAAMLPFMPRVEANITPLATEGALAGASEAARVSLRLTLPGMPGLGGRDDAGEVILVDAVEARAADGTTLRLEGVEAPAALPGKG